MLLGSIVSYLNGHFKGNGLNKRDYIRLIKNFSCYFPHTRIHKKNRRMLILKKNILIRI